MAYLVNFTARAVRDLGHLYREINAKHSDAALIWYRGFKEAILSLGEQPNRSPITPESEGQASALRQQAACLSCDITRAGKAETG